MNGNEGLTVADAIALRNDDNSGFGGSNGAWWLIILILFFAMGGWGRGFGNDNGGTTIVNPSPMGFGGGAYVNLDNAIQKGFDQSAIMAGLNGLNTTVSTGFSNAEVSRCNAQANLLQTLNANQNATTAGMNAIASSLQNCCCENRAATQDLKYTIATENCADRAAVNDGVRDIIESNTRNTQAILDKLCQQEIDAKNDLIDNLRTQLNLANLAASQTQQTAQILADNMAQTNALEQYLAPVPRPAYIVQNPNGCGCNNFNYGCGCGL